MKRPQKRMVRKLREQNTILRDLWNIRRTFKQGRIRKKLYKIGPSSRFGQQTIQQTLENAHAKIDQAILMARRGKLVYPAFLLGQMRATANALNDHEYMRWAVSRRAQP